MEFQAHLIDIDSAFHKRLIFSVESDSRSLMDYYNENHDKQLTLKTHVTREKRSRDANAYYWAMLSKLASKLGNSNNRQHNLLLASYSEVETIDGKVIEVEIPESDSASEAVWESSEHHLRPTSQLIIRDEDVYRVHQMMMGSHTLNTKQFARLLDGLLSECREQGIPIISDQEYERMIQAYGHSIR